MEISCSSVYTKKTDSAEFESVATHQHIDVAIILSGFRFKTHVQPSWLRIGLDLARLSSPSVDNSGFQKCLFSVDDAAFGSRIG